MSEHKAAIEEPGLFDAAENKQADEAVKTVADTKSRGGAQDPALAAANERADRLEAEMAELKELVKSMAAGREKSSRRGAADTASTDSRPAARAKSEAAEALSKAVHPEGEDQGRSGAHASGPGGAKGGIPVRDGSSSGDSEARREAGARVEAGDDASASKQPPSPSSAAGEPGVGGGEEELRKDSMMAHLLDSLEAGHDIGHYGRLTFAMIARHFLPHDEVLARLLKDEDLGEEEAEQMLLQVEQRDYSPPRRDRILQWQSEQEFPILPDVDDPDSGNVYRNLNFPKEIYSHIGHYREQKAEAEE